MASEQWAYVIDSSAIINIKKKVPQGKQWALFRQLEKYIEAGVLTFPRQVKAEVCGMAHPDAPGVWADGVYPNIKLPTEVQPPYIKAVMQSPASAVVDPDKTREDGDPYLIALALQIAAAGQRCAVITDDVKDNPRRISVLTACGYLQVPCITLQAFLQPLGFDYQP